MDRKDTNPTVGTLLHWYMVDLDQVRKFGATHRCALNALMRMPIGHKSAADLTPADIIEHCRMRLRAGAHPATIRQDITYLRGPLGYASVGFGLKNISTRAIEEAMPHLAKHNLAGKSRPRDRRPTGAEWDTLIAHFKTQDQDWHTKIPMAEIIEFQVWSARRIGETCRIKFADVDREKRTVIVRDMKDPRQKKGNDVEVPLLGRAWELVDARFAQWDGDPNARIYPYNSKSVSARFTVGKAHLGIKNLRLHDLRREAASRLFEAGYSVQEVMLVTGHKTPNMLLRVYTKLKPEDLHRGPASMRITANNGEGNARRPY